MNDASRAELEVLKWRDALKNYETLCAYAERGAPARSRRFVVEFYRSPVALSGDGRLERVTFERNRLEGEVGRQRAVGTGETYDTECGVLFRSVGYRGVPIEGVPFDEARGVFPNVQGRVVEGGDVVRGLYAVGWIKRGPSGVIGTNKPDSIETAKHVIADIPDLAPCAHPRREDVVALLLGRNVRVVDYAGWMRIDAAETERGRAVGKPREKFTTIEEMIRAAGPREGVSS